LRITVDFDVAIIGAGPAGTSAAISCRKAGLKVAILESVPFPRFQVGESLHPGAEVLCQQLGVAHSILNEGFLRYEGIWTLRAGKRRFTPFGSDSRGKWMGFQVDRARFDAILLERAHQNGAHIFWCCAHAVRRTPCGVLIESQLGQLKCRVVIDATGSRRWVARQFGLDTLRRSPTILARYGYREGQVPHLSQCPIFSIREKGWHWFAKVAANRYQWISASWATDSHPSMPEEMKPLHPASPVRGSDVTWRMLCSAAERDFFAVGDAAAIVDPASSHGILRALASGLMAAHCIKSIFSAPRSACGIAQLYSDWIHRGFTRDTNRMKQIYGSWSGLEMSDWSVY
jgi:flavin-dependent dehydrogenase